MNITSYLIQKADEAVVLANLTIHITFFILFLVLLLNILFIIYLIIVKKGCR